MFLIQKEVNNIIYLIKNYQMKITIIQHLSKEEKLQQNILIII